MPFFGVPIRNGLPIGLGSVAGFGVQQFDPSELFAGGTAGAWYDPSDLTTLFTTSAGTTQCAMPGQGSAVSVGLMLDKSQGLALGPELVTNGDFGGGTTTGWASSSSFSSTATVTSGELVVTATAASGRQVSAITCVVGRWYLVTGSCRLISGTGGAFIGISDADTGAGIYTATNNTTSTPLTTRGQFRATATTMYVAVGSTGGTGVTAFDNISVRELPGNHAIAFNNTTARPELRARVNLLTYSEDLNGSGWTKQSCTMSIGVTDPNGGTTAIGIIPNNGSNAFSGFFQAPGFASGSYIQRWLLKRGSKRYFWITTNGGSTKTFCDWDTLSGVSGNTVVFSPLSDGWYAVTATGTQAVDAGVYPCDANNSTVCVGDGVTVAIYCCKPDLRPANIGANVPAYQRIADANTYDTSGFPLYLRFDGIDDSMYTPANLNLSGTDKVAVFAGVRKLSDASIGVAMETSINSGNNNGALMLTTSGQVTPGAKYGSTLRGTALIYAETATAYAAPRSDVLALINDIAQSTAATEQIMRISGAQVALTFVGADAGTGNLGTYPLFIGSRNNASAWLNGHLHSLIIAGSAVSAGNISATEQWVAGKTGITI